MDKDGCVNGYVDEGWMGGHVGVWMGGQVGVWMGGWEDGLING